MEYTVKELIEKLQTLEPDRKIHILGQGMREGVIQSNIKVQNIKDYYSEHLPYSFEEKDYTLEDYSMFDIVIH